MTESSRKGVRLPWLGDQEEQGTEMPSGDNGAMTDQAEEAVTPDAGTAPAAAPSAPVAEASEPFLDDLVQAMRQITEQARDEALAQLRAAAATRSAELRTATEARAAELRDLADADVQQVADWEQGEMERVATEAAAKVSARKAKLDSQLKANTASGEGAMSAVQGRIDAFEREMAAFFAQLNDMHDPVAFASAVKRMPRAPSLSDTPAAPSEHTAPAPAGTPTAAAPASRVEAAATAETATTPADTTSTVDAEAAPADPAATSSEPEVAAQEAPQAETAAETAQEPETEEASTQVLVTGLTSFGAITSFKQSLERVAGVRRVSMGLGTSGEFIFTAVHGVGFDVTQAIQSFEAGAQFVSTDDQLRVTIGPKD